MLRLWVRFDFSRPACRRRLPFLGLVGLGRAVALVRDDWKVELALEGTASRPRVGEMVPGSAAPLLEEETHVGVFAPGSDPPHPVLVDFPGSGARSASGDDPVVVVPVTSADKDGAVAR